MRIDRIKNSKRNMLFGVISRACYTILPFINRTVLIYVLGVEYLGLNSLFSSVLNILNLAELGFGSAIVYSMYKPIADNDDSKICALLSFYKKVYRIIGFGILVAGLLSLIFIDKLVKGDVPVDINIRLIFLIQLSNVVVSYFLWAYKTSLLSAFQREDLVSKISILTVCLQYGVQFAVLFLFRNYYIYLIILPLGTTLNNILKAIVTNKYYSQYKCQGSLDSETKSVIGEKVKALLLHKVGGVVANSLDNIVISAFMGLVAIAMYNNYWYIYSSVCYFIAIFHNSVLAGIGNSMAIESKENNLRKFNDLNFVNVWIVGWCSCCLMCLYQPFMELWVGKKLMYSLDVVILFVIYFYINMARRTVITFKEASGLWTEDRYKPIVSAVFNITLNIVLIQMIGIPGVVISTILSFIIIEIPWESSVLFKNYFEKGLSSYYLSQLLYGAFFAVIIIGTYMICSIFDSGLVFTLIIRGCICIVIPNVIVVLVFKEKVKKAIKYIKKK